MCVARSRLDAGKREGGRRCRSLTTSGPEPPSGPRCGIREAEPSSTALLAGGMTGFVPEALDVSIPANNRRWRQDGVLLHQRATMPPIITAGIPRVRMDVAAVHAAGWARTDRQAALVLCLVTQQRLVPAARLAAAWRSRARRAVRRSRRRVLDGVVADLTRGAQSLGELDFGELCRKWGLPRPTRQVVKRTPHGRVYLDAAWEDIGLVVEVDGMGHLQGMAPVADALRQNDLALENLRVPRIPVLGLRLQPDEFGVQVARAYRLLSTGAGSAA